MCTYAYVNIHTYIDMNISIHTDIYIYIYIEMDIYIYVYRYIHIYTYIYMLAPPQKKTNLHFTTFHTLKQPRLSCRKGNCTLCWCVLPYLCGCKVMKPSGPSQRSKASTPRELFFNI